MIGSPYGNKPCTPPHPPSEGWVKMMHAIGEGGLSRDTARSLVCSSPKGATGQGLEATQNPPSNERHFRSMGASQAKACPLGDDRPDLPMFATPGDWQPTLGEFKKALSKLKTGKAQDLGGWSSELLQHSLRTPYLRDLGHKWIISMAVATNLHARRSELLHATQTWLP